MIKIEDKIISTELFQTRFICNLERCLGACCVYGDSGAPLEKKEALILEDEAARIANYITGEGLTAIEKEGPWLTDGDDDLVTPLIDGKECAYAVFKNGIATCGIEIAYHEKAIKFRKPISCHLYPIRVSKMGEYTVLNYHRWQVCEPALDLGNKEGVPLFRFLKEVIIRKWGVGFYNEMENVYNELQKTEMLFNS